ncbi:hypothetical protein [Microvirga sp. G4-2]|uniref:hypothetical protein n=1 Tax=Microvirga sp. G4-2 TaxID=3434467 RepID=UPI004043C269
MNRTLLALFALTAGALLIPEVADAQRGGRGGGFGGGGARMSGGFGGGGARMGGGSIGGPRMYIPRGGMSGPRFGAGGGLTTGSIAARPGGMPGRMAGITPGAGGFRRVAINNPGGRFDNRFGNRGDWRYGYGATGGRYRYYSGRYPYYGGRYPYYGRYYSRYHGRYPYYGWGLATGALIGAAATYPYYNDSYYGYPYYSYPYSTYQTPIASASGGYCVTPVRTCALTSSAPIGTGCSCSTPGGRARGTVQ